MQANHKKLIESLTPIMWEPGHMGSFFGKFLLDDKKTIDNIDIYQTTNLEWNWDDIIDNYMISRRPNNQILHPFSSSSEILSKHYTTPAELDSAIIFANIYHRYKFIKKPISLNNYISKIDNPEKYLLDIVNKEFTLDHIIADKNFTVNDINFPYIKSHTILNYNAIEQLSWKKKIYCSFPPEKFWIPTLLVLYKHYVFYKNQWDGSNNIVYRLIGMVEDPYFLNEVYQELLQIEKFNSYIKVDMYDLIFNQNLSQLHGIDDIDINKLSQTRKNLLDRAKDNTTFICNKFGLDPSMDITLDQGSEKLRTPEVIEMYKEFIKNRKEIRFFKQFLN